MVRAILNGRKTQTRRVIKPQPPCALESVDAPPFLGWRLVDKKLANADEHYGWRSPPYGQPGDRLWVRETWARSYTGLDTFPPHYRADFPDDKNDALTENHAFGLMQWKPSIHMPRALSRLTLEITEVRVQRVNEISEADARAEGVTIKTIDVRPGHANREEFQDVWHKINGKRPGCSWADNPWVWVVVFKRSDSA
jgi:hypothetical protein